MSPRSNLHPRRVPRRRRSGQVLVLLVGALFLGASSTLAVGLLTSGRSTDELKKQTKELLPEGEARDRTDAIYERWKKQVEEYTDRRDKNGKKVAELLERHDATRADFASLLGEIDKENLEVWGQVRQCLTDLRAEIPADGWTKLFPPPPKPSHSSAPAAGAGS